MRLSRLVEVLDNRKNVLSKQYEDERVKITVMSNGSLRAEVNKLAGRLDELEDIVNMLNMARELGAEE